MVAIPIACGVTGGDICAALAVSLAIAVSQSFDNELSVAFVAWVLESGHGLRLILERGLSFLIADSRSLPE